MEHILELVNRNLEHKNMGFMKKGETVFEIMAIYRQMSGISLSDIERIDNAFDSVLGEICQFINFPDYHFDKEKEIFVKDE